MKNVTVNLDEVEFKKFQQIIGKHHVSEAFRKFVSSTINHDTMDVKAIDIELLRMDIEKLKKQSIYINSELSNKQEKVAKIQEKVVEIEENRLKNEKIALENAKKCLKCGRNLDAELKTFKFSRGCVCKVCFTNATNEDYKLWEG